MDPRFDDETLMRYADGTADAGELRALEAALATDAALAARVAEFRRIAALAHAAMNEVLHEPVPQRLVDAVLNAPVAPRAMFDDETLMAYADGALDAVAAARVAKAARGERDVAARVETFRRTAMLARAALAPVVDEPVPARLVAAVRDTPTGANVASFRPRAKAGGLRRPLAWAVAASVALFVVLGAGGVFTGRIQPQIGGLELASTDRWLDNVAGFYNVAEATQASEGRLLVDFTTEDMPELGKWFGAKLNRNLALPDLSAQGFALQGGRMLVVGGRPAAQLLYKNGNNEVVGLVIAFSERREQAPRADLRQGVNVVHWHRGGYAYAFAGRIDGQRLRGLADQAWTELEAI
ncbi:MAG: anti-sigma factor [Rhodospirillales bacterium]|nr:anti-sigma factor [Rhodospirillales bacterium]